MENTQALVLCLLFQHFNIVGFIKHCRAVDIYSKCWPMEQHMIAMCTWKCTTPESTYLSATAQCWHCTRMQSLDHKTCSIWVDIWLPWYRRAKQTRHEGSQWLPLETISGPPLFLLGLFLLMLRWNLNSFTQKKSSAVSLGSVKCYILHLSPDSNKYLRLLPQKRFDDTIEIKISNHPCLLEIARKNNQCLEVAHWNWNPAYQSFLFGGEIKALPCLSLSTFLVSVTVTGCWLKSFHCFPGVILSLLVSVMSGWTCPDKIHTQKKQ